MAGTLYLCATPIGNLQDMTPRAAEAAQAPSPDETIYTPESDPAHWMRNAQGAGNRALSHTTYGSRLSPAR